MCGGVGYCNIRSVMGRFPYPDPLSLQFPAVKYIIFQLWSVICTDQCTYSCWCKCIFQCISIHLLFRHNIKSLLKHNFLLFFFYVSFYKKYILNICYWGDVLLKPAVTQTHLTAAQRYSHKKAFPAKLFPLMNQRISGISGSSGSFAAVIS